MDKLTSQEIELLLALVNNNLLYLNKCLMSAEKHKRLKSLEYHKKRWIEWMRIRQKLEQQ